MLIKNDFEVAQPVEKVWEFFGDIPQVAACLPGTELTDDLGDDTYEGTGGGPDGAGQASVRGKAKITERDEAAKRIVVDASGAEARGRGQAAMVVTATLTRSGTRHQGRRGPGPAAVRRRRPVRPGHDLRRHDRADARLLGQPGQGRIDAAERGESADAPATAAPASGFALGLRAARMALTRVFRRFFLPYQPSQG